MLDARDRKGTTIYTHIHPDKRCGKATHFTYKNPKNRLPAFCLRLLSSKSLCIFTKWQRTSGIERMRAEQCQRTRCEETAIEASFQTTADQTFRSYAQSEAEVISLSLCKWLWRQQRIGSMHRSEAVCSYYGEKAVNAH
jgi:hypothetical protein